MTITAKFSGKCYACGGAIPRGAIIEWSKGSGARHIDCSAPSAIVADVPARRGTSCPTCKGPMSAAYARKGYQCDSCADRSEGVGYWS